MSTKLSLLLEDINDNLEMEGFISAIIDKLTKKAERQKNNRKENKETKTEHVTGARTIKFSANWKDLSSIINPKALIRELQTTEEIVKAQIKLLHALTDIVHGGKRDNVVEKIKAAIESHKLNKHTAFASSYKSGRKPKNHPRHDGQFTYVFSDTEFNTTLKIIDDITDAIDDFPVENIINEIDDIILNKDNQADFREAFNLIDHEAGELMAPYGALVSLRKVLLYHI